MKLIIPILIMLFVAAVFILPQQIAMISKNQIPAKNSFDNDDMIIALIRGYSHAYQFVLFNGNQLEVSYGEIRDADPSKFGPYIASIDFMLTIEESSTTTIPEDVYERIIALANEVADEIPSDLSLNAVFATDPYALSRLTIIRQDGIYEIGYPNVYITNDMTLIDLINRHSPIIVDSGWTQNITKEELMER